MQTVAPIFLFSLASKKGLIVFFCLFQGTDASVGDGFAPLGPPLFPWENCMGRGQQQINDNTRTSRLSDQIGPVGRFGEKSLKKSCKASLPCDSAPAGDVLLYFSYKYIK